jgi:hypothetical protein
MTTKTEILTDAQLRDVRTIGRAIEQADADRAKLTPGGQRLYSVEEHQRREQAIETTLQAEIERVTEQADAAVREAAATVERLTDADPLIALTAAEQEAASRRATFVREDAERLPLPDLTRRLTQAMDEDDRASLYLWARYADARLQAEQRAGRLGPAAAEELHRLAAVLREAGERFTDQRGRERATAKLETARAFRARVSQVVHPLLVGRTLAEMRRDSRYRL